MNLIAKDQLHISSVKADNILPGEKFEVSDLQGRSLIERGLATEVKPAGRPAAKKAGEPANKKAADPQNKKG